MNKFVFWALALLYCITVIFFTTKGCNATFFDKPTAVQVVSDTVVVNTSDTIYQIVDRIVTKKPIVVRDTFYIPTDRDDTPNPLTFNSTHELGDTNYSFVLTTHTEITKDSIIQNVTLDSLYVKTYTQLIRDTSYIIITNNTQTTIPRPRWNFGGGVAIIDGRFHVAPSISYKKHSLSLIVGRNSGLSYTTWIR